MKFGDKKRFAQRKKVKEAELESLQKQGSALTVTNQTEGASLGNLFTANQFQRCDIF